MRSPARIPAPPVRRARPQRSPTNPGSLGHSFLVVEQLINVHGLEGLLEVGRALPSNLQKSLRHVFPGISPHALQALANRLTHGERHAFAGNFGEFLGQPVGFLVLDVQAHNSTSLPHPSTILPYSIDNQSALNLLEEEPLSRLR